ncbi:MAG: hypothetical protein ACRDOL_35395 [Streptosporangiaceae bacterium]
MSTARHPSATRPATDSAGVLTFLKVHGAGNDFILFADPDQDRDWPEEARRLCARGTGIGADGLVVTTRRGPAAFEVWCFNADGSAAARRRRAWSLSILLCELGPAGLVRLLGDNCRQVAARTGGRRDQRDPRADELLQVPVQPHQRVPGVLGRGRVPPNGRDGDLLILYRASSVLDACRVVQAEQVD